MVIDALGVVLGSCLVSIDRRVSGKNIKTMLQQTFVGIVCIATGY